MELQKENIKIPTLELEVQNLRACVQLLTSENQTLKKKELKMEQKLKDIYYKNSKQAQMLDKFVIFDRSIPSLESIKMGQ